MKCYRCLHAAALHVAIDGCLARGCRCELNQGAVVTANEKVPGRISQDAPQHDTSTIEASNGESNG